MDLIGRYLHAVKFWLPKRQGADIVAELSEDIRAQVEEREHDLGRPLTSDEVSALLRQRGRPVLVANRYLPQEYLIGPALFPIYKFVLKIVALCSLVPFAVVSISLVAAGASGAIDREFHGWVVMFEHGWSSLWETAFVSAGVVTLVFACLERAQARSHFLEAWDPAKLPPVRDSGAISRTSSGILLAVNLVFTVWWVANMNSNIVPQHASAHLVLSPSWTLFFWALLALAAANAALAGINLLHPRWTRARASCRLLFDALGSVVFALLLKAGIVADIIGFGMSAQQSSLAKLPRP
jgi:hypothetical protein